MAWVIALALLAATCFVPAAASAGPTIDLNTPGALEALEQANPAHYAKVKLILHGVTRQRDADVPRWLRVGFDARDVNYAPIVLTSHPARRRLSFALDATRYEAVIVLTHLRGDIIPLK
jgi:predicted dienelactone hydrolase